jgi:hypothetical protein
MPAVRQRRSREVKQIIGIHGRAARDTGLLGILTLAQ